MTDTDYAWNRRDDEPVAWYERFIRYYIPLGTTRSLFKAYKVCLAIEDPKQLEKLDDKSNTPLDWSRAANEYEWVERAAAYDEKMFSDEGAVELARQLLKNSALDAATTLHRALSNPRLQVAAAKEILDRSGVLAASIQLSKELPFTADEMAEATKEIEEWEKNAKSG